MSGMLEKAGLGALVAMALALAVAPAAHGVTLKPGDILVADDSALGGNGAILLIDRESGNQTVVSSAGLFSHPVDLALTPLGQLYVADQNADGGTGAVIRVDPATGAQTEVSTGGFFQDPTGIAREPSGHMVVVDHADVVVRVDLVTGEQQEVSSDMNFDFPTGVTVDPSAGTIWVTDEDATPSFMGGLIRVNPLTGQQTIVADNPDPVDPIGFNDPQSPEIERSTGKILVTDDDANSEEMGSDHRGSLFRVDPLTGQTSRVTTAGFFGNPMGVAVGIGGTIFVTDVAAVPGEFNGGIIAVNPKTGAQEIVALGDNAPDNPLYRPNDLLMVPHRCKGRFATILGTRGRDVITGTPYADVIVTYRGRDRVNAKAGDDIVCGGRGADSLGGARGRDNLFGQAGRDKLFGGADKDRLRGGPGVDLTRR